MENLNLRPIEQAKISCAKKLFNEMSTSKVKYHDVDSYQNTLNVMDSDCRFIGRYHCLKQKEIILNSATDSINGHLI